jgi:hypothetical protein
MMINYISGWWLTYPSEIVSWDDEIPNIWKNKNHVPHHQPDSDLISQLITNNNIITAMKHH